MAKNMRTNADLMAWVLAHLPKRIPADAVSYVELDLSGGSSDRPDGVSYWVFFKDGYVTEDGDGCHIIHQDFLFEVREELRHVVYDPADIRPCAR